MEMMRRGSNGVTSSRYSTTSNEDGGQQQSHFGQIERDSELPAGDPRRSTASPASFFGSRDPVEDPQEETRENSFLKFSLSRRGSDVFSFNTAYIRQEPEEEIKMFKDFVSVYGEAGFHQSEETSAPPKEREFVASSDPEEWKHVEALMPMELVPPLPERKDFPSGFVPPKASPGDYPYFVRRTASHMLPVYTKFNRKRMLMQTVVRRADGNLFSLRDDIDAFLKERYNMEFVSQVAELHGIVKYRGYFEEDFKEFLLSKGF